MKTVEDLKQEYHNIKMNEEQVKQLKDRMNQAKTDKTNSNVKQSRNRTYWRRGLATAAAVALVFVALPNTSASVAKAMGEIPVLGNLVKVVTFRNYQYQSERNNADIEVPKIDSEGKTGTSQSEKNLKKSTKEINREISKISNDIIKEFEESKKQEEGFQDVVVKSQVMATTQDYFTLKLICYQGSGSGAEWDYYYTIDLQSGKRMQLGDLFKAGADYVTPISDNIKEQMRAQMKKDPNVSYWLDDSEVEEWNFDKIDENQNFYINDKGNIVICFNEGEVAPMSMGCVSFEIPAKVVEAVH